MRPALKSPFVTAVALLLLAGTMAACRNSPSVDAAPLPPRTIAILRAVQSGQPENQIAFFSELEAAGYVRGENLTVLGEDLSEVYPDEAGARQALEGWLAQDVDLIVALSTTGAQTAADVAPDLPIAFLVNDPMAAGLVQDERAPEGQLTGVTFRVPPDRTLDLIRQAFPGAPSFGVLHPPADPAAVPVRQGALQAAANLAIPIQEATFTDDQDLPMAFASLEQHGVGAVWALNSPTTVRYIDQIGASASASSLPVVANTATDVATVILQPDVPQLYRQLGRQVLRLLDGVAVRAVPVENPSRFNLTVNLRSAAAAGVSVPEAVIAQADRVIR